MGLRIAHAFGKHDIGNRKAPAHQPVATLEMGLDARERALECVAGGRNFGSSFRGLRLAFCIWVQNIKPRSLD